MRQTAASPRPFRAAAALALALLLPVAAHAQTERRTITGDRVAIYDLAGHLRVDGGSGSAVVVEVTRGGRDASKLELRTGAIGGRETLRVVFPADRIVYPELGRGSNSSLSVNDDGTFGDGNEGRGFFRRGGRVEIRGSGSGLEAWADLHVMVPRGKALDLHLGAGDVHIANVDGDLRVDVSAAPVTSEHTRGRLDFDTGSGAVSVTDAEGEVNLDTGSGGVTLQNVRGPSLRLDTGSGSVRGDVIDVQELVADVGSGGISLHHTKAPRMNLDTGSGGTDVELLSGVEELVVDGGSGGVTIRVPATLSADVDIDTGSGGIETDFPVKVTRWERTHLSGTIGDGHGRIRIDSGSGRVRLLRS